MLPTWPATDVSRPLCAGCLRGRLTVDLFQIGWILGLFHGCNVFLDLRQPQARKMLSAATGDLDRKLRRTFNAGLDSAMGQEWYARWPQALMQDAPGAVAKDGRGLHLKVISFLAVQDFIRLKLPIHALTRWPEWGSFLNFTNGYFTVAARDARKGGKLDVADFEREFAKVAGEMRADAEFARGCPGVAPVTMRFVELSRLPSSVEKVEEIAAAILELGKAVDKAEMA